MTRVSRDRGGKPVEIFHEFDRAIPLSSAGTIDGHVLALFLYAAEIGKPLIVHGTLSLVLMRNLEELALLFSRLQPHRYRRFEVVPEAIADCAPPRAQAAIAAFSGGADGTFTALRHAEALNRHAAHVRYALRAVLMVQGFDVDIYNFDDFAKLIARQIASALLNVEAFQAEHERAQSADALALEVEHRRRIERQQNLLLDELNHRVKNTLATVQALAIQTLKGQDIPARDPNFFTTGGKPAKMKRDYPMSRLVAELVRIEGDKVVRSEAVVTSLPYRMPTPWK